MNDGCIKNHDDVWIPRSSFPKVEDDVLLYLLLMGGRHHPAFRLDGQPVPYSHFLMKVLTDDRSHILDFSSAARKSTDGMFLESLLSSTVCLASHSNGIGGISLNQFLMNLVYQLQMENVEAGAVTIAGLEKLNGLLQFTIPFLSPENQKWPDTLLQIPGANLGYLERPQNEDKVDLRTTCGIFGESTDYERKMTIKTLRQILRRVPEQATVELVFTRDLQESYFTRSSKSFEDEFQGSHLLNMVFYKIDTSSPSTSLEPIQGLPSANPNARRAVIFFLINGSLSMKS
ncbi:hypothetical protein BC833DRAFT_567521 [Globomyces pollinis-pini]|nr:hypothetical protein BC833DRAFT_567521 [Globomyces pollinis-pini]